MKTYFFVCYLLLISLLVSCNDKINNPTDSKTAAIVSIDPMVGIPYDHFQITCINFGGQIDFPKVYIGKKDSLNECRYYSIKAGINDTLKYEYILPPNAKTGKIIIVLKNIELTSKDNFVILDSNSINSYPEIYSISPMSGRANETFEIIGKNLGTRLQIPQVFFGSPEKGIEFEVIYFLTNDAKDTNRIICRIPENVLGLAKIYVKAGTNTIQKFGDFEILSPYDVKPIEVISFFPPSFCSSENFYVKGKNFLGHKIRVTFDSFETKIISTSDSLITITMPPNMPYNDYEVVLHDEQNSFYNGLTFRTKKIIYGKPTLNSVVPAANAVGGSVTIYADNIGSTVPRVFFGNSEAKVTSYSLANYGSSYHQGDPREYIERFGGYIKCIVPPGASTPIYIRGNCGDIDLTSKFSFIPFTVKSVQLELRNINWKYSFQSEYGGSYDSSGTFSYFVNPCSNITGYDNDTKLMELYAAGSYLNSYNGTDEIKQSYAFKNDDISFGNFSDYYSSTYTPGHTINSNYRKFSCHLGRIDKSYENDSAVVYTMNRNEIDQYLSDLQYEYGEAHGWMNAFVRSKYIITQQLPASDSSKIILTIFKK